MMPGICEGGCIVEAPGEGAMITPGICCAPADHAVAKTAAVTTSLATGRQVRRIEPRSGFELSGRWPMFTRIDSCPSLDLRTQIAG